MFGWLWKLVIEPLGFGTATKTVRLIARIGIGARYACDTALGVRQISDANTQARYSCAVAVNYGG